MLSASSLSSLQALLPRDKQRGTTRPYSTVVALSIKENIHPLVDKKEPFAHVTPTALLMTATKQIILTAAVTTSLEMSKTHQDLLAHEEPGASFRVGNRVVTHDGRPGKIIAKTQQKGLKICSVEFESGETGNYPEQELFFDVPAIMTILEETDWSLYPQKTVVSFTKQVCTASSSRYLEYLLLSSYQPEVVGKYMRDASKEALRRLEGTGSRFSACGEMLTAGTYASVVTHSSLFIVETLHDTIRFLNHKRLEMRHGATKPQWSFSCFASKALRNLVNSSASILASGVGASVGTLIWPGLGTSVGVVVGDTIMYLL